jgi:hypothetical protein
MNSIVYNFQNIDPNSLSFDAPLKKKNLNGKSTYLSKISSNGTNLFILSPKLKCIDYNEKTSQIQLDLDSSLDFKNFLTDLNSVVKNKIYNNSFAWFNKSLSKDYISNSFIPSFTSSSGTLSLSLPDIPVLCNLPGNPLDNLIDSDLILVFDISGIWFSQQHFGLRLRISKIKVSHTKYKLHDYSINDSDSDFDYPSDIDSEPSDSISLLNPEKEPCDYPGTPELTPTENFSGIELFFDTL